MYTPQIKEALRQMPVRPVDFTFSFGCTLLDGTLDAVEIDPARWYLMPND
jgi:hypothetical protein